MQSTIHVYEVGPRKDKRGVRSNLDALPPRAWPLQSQPASITEIDSESQFNAAARLSTDELCRTENMIENCLCLTVLNEQIGGCDYFCVGFRFENDAHRAAPGR
jgi:hypothetical protein